MLGSRYILAAWPGDKDGTLQALHTSGARTGDRCAHAWWGSFQFQRRLHRASLTKWTGRTISTKQAAAAALDDMKDAIRGERFESTPSGANLTFDAFADLYIERYVELRQLRSQDTVEFRLRLLRKRFGHLRLRDIRVGEIEDLIQDLKARGRKPATVNRSLALLRHMMNWAIGREYLRETPFRRGTQALITFEREDNRRVRRVSPEEEAALLAHANSQTQARCPALALFIIAALDTGLRRGSLLSLQCGDIDADQQVIHVRREHAKGKKRYVVPIGTNRLQGVVEWLLTDAAGARRPATAPLFARPGDVSVKSFRTAWENTRRRAGLSDVRFHDLRAEYASRLIEHGVPLSQVRDLLGHASIVTTERYDRQRLDNLKEAVRCLDTGQSFKNLSSLPSEEDLLGSVSPTQSTRSRSGGIGRRAGLKIQ